jgi:hypothetical protein
LCLDVQMVSLSFSPLESERAAFSHVSRNDKDYEYTGLRTFSWRSSSRLHVPVRVTWEAQQVQFRLSSCHSRVFTAPLIAPTGAVEGTIRVLALLWLRLDCICCIVSSPLFPQTAVRSVQFHPNACHTRVFTAPATALTGALTGTLPSLHPLRVRRDFTDCTSAFVEHKRKRPEGQSPLPDSGTG